MAVATKTKDKIIDKKFKELEIKASILDELVEFIEDRYLGYLMHLTEKEKNIPFQKAKNLLRR